MIKLNLTSKSSNYIKILGNITSLTVPQDPIQLDPETLQTQGETMTIKEQITQELEKLPEPVLPEILDFVQFLQTKHEQRNMLEITIMSESSLQKDWLKPEEEAVWQDL